ncbi:G-protein coupled receptor Mth2-like isoform X1 [Arctopsyche grandis]|uniref:G-protein coupled receptor Mth2-like isoform X1 n=1 Tax=Arctopsyche grandis TaxID=121162 RepID=UPI00406DA42D
MTIQHLVTFLLVTIAHCTLIRKCCPHGESFNGSEVCEKSNNTDWILSDNFVVQSSQSTLKIPKDPKAAIKEIYKGKIEIGFPECNKSFSDVITMWKDLSLTKRFYLLHDTTKSQVMLNFHRTSAHHDNATLSFSKFFKPESYCIDGGTRDSFVVNLCPCSSSTCIRKCCYENEVFDQTTNDCVDINNIGLNTTYEDWTPRFEESGVISQEEHDYFLLLGKLPPCYEERGVYPQYQTNDNSFIYWNNGSVNMNTSTVDMLSLDEHCGDFAWNQTRGTLEQMMLICYSKSSVDEKIRQEKLLPFYTVLMAITALLLVASALVIYLGWNPDLEGKRGSVPILFHVSNLVVANTVAVFSYLWSSSAGSAGCIISGYIMQFSFLAAFFWLNVMCIDMSWTFSGIRPPSGSQNERERRKFVWYSIYAWGGASLLTLTAIVVDFTPGVPQDSVLKPNIGVIKCWFKEKEALWLYFYGPMGILLLTNLVLFVYTSIRILILKRGTSALHQADSARHGRGNKNKQRFVLYAKLFLLMGVTWLTEIISWAVGNSTVLNYLWYITDMINLLRAVFIFIIFCWKPRVWNNVKKKMPCLKQCENFVKQRCCGTNSSQDVQDEQKTTSTTQKESETSRIDVIEMQAK